MESGEEKRRYKTIPHLTTSCLHTPEEKVPDRVRLVAQEGEHLLCVAIDKVRRYVYVMGREKCRFHKTSSITEYCSHCNDPLSERAKIGVGGGERSVSSLFMYRYTLSNSARELAAWMSLVHPLGDWPPGIVPLVAEYVGYQSNHYEKFHISTVIHEHAQTEAVNQMFVESRRGDLYATLGGVTRRCLVHIRVGPGPVLDARLRFFNDTMVCVNHLMSDQDGHLFLWCIFPLNAFWSLDVSSHPDVIVLTLAFQLPAKGEYIYPTSAFFRSDTNQLCLLIEEEGPDHQLVQFIDSEQFTVQLSFSKTFHEVLSYDERQAVVLLCEYPCQLLHIPLDRSTIVPTCVACNLTGFYINQIALDDGSWFFWIQDSKTLCSTPLPRLL